MHTRFGNKDLRTLRLLHEYGFTDAELAEHLRISPLAVRRMRIRMGLQANGQTKGVIRDRRVAREASLLHPLQPMLGAHTRQPTAVFMKLVDDRAFVEA